MCSGHAADMPPRSPRFTRGHRLHLRADAEQRGGRSVLRTAVDVSIAGIDMFTGRIDASIRPMTIDAFIARLQAERAAANHNLIGRAARAPPSAQQVRHGPDAG